MSESSFPSLRITARGFEPRGSFAVAQSTYLKPDAATVQQLADLAGDKKIGVVAHYYMDVELQGILHACPHAQIDIADSLKMADSAVKMAEAGMETIVVLGVDFMSENVRAVLDAAGHADVMVYRLAEAEIGCSLAESAESENYMQWLRDAAKVPNALHVVYINTSLLTKAQAHHIVPTLTCTSSNVVQTILQAAAQVPDVAIFYGPDTYMGGNLHAMFTQFAELDDAAIRELHPAHNQASIRRLLGNFHYYRQGACVVHHMFGDDVVQRVLAEHSDALITAHLEVPGEMFRLAHEAAAEGRGAVGSTSNILGFIVDRVEQAVGVDGPAVIPVILGTEAGMITAIVRRVQEVLLASGREDVSVEVVFPVASEAVAQSDQFGIVPGVAGGEGCSVAGGCATCPYMKMNDVDALFHVVEGVGTETPLGGYEPRKYEELVGGRSAADLGCEPILHMRHFQRTEELPEALIEHVLR